MVSKWLVTCNLLINMVYWGYNPFTNLLLTSWDIQVPPLETRVFYRPAPGIIFKHIRRRVILENTWTALYLSKKALFLGGKGWGVTLFSLKSWFSGKLPLSPVRKRILEIHLFFTEPWLWEEKANSEFRLNGKKYLLTEWIPPQLSKLKANNFASEFAHLCIDCLKINLEEKMVMLIRVQMNLPPSLDSFQFSPTRLVKEKFLSGQRKSFHRKGAKKFENLRHTNQHLECRLHFLNST